MPAKAGIQYSFFVIILVDTCFSDNLKYISAKAIDTRNLKMYFNLNQFNQ